MSIPNRVPTSSSKYPDHLQNLKVSVKGSGWKSYNPREPVRSIVPSYPETAHYRDTRAKKFLPMNSPSPEVFEHVWDEGSKRPKTQNERWRRKSQDKQENTHLEIFPKEGKAGLYEVPIIVIRDDKSRRVVSAKRNGTAKGSNRPMTFNPGKSSLITSLDQEFLDLFNV